MSIYNQVGGNTVAGFACGRVRLVHEHLRLERGQIDV